MKSIKVKKAHEVMANFDSQDINLKIKRVVRIFYSTKARSFLVVREHTCSMSLAWQELIKGSGIRCEKSEPLCGKFSSVFSDGVSYHSSSTTTE